MIRDYAPESRRPTSVADYDGTDQSISSRLYVGVVGDDTWASLADKFADEAYASVKGYVRSYVMHHQSQFCQCAVAGGVVSIMTGNAKAAAVRPAMERRWDDALASFDARTE